MSPVCPDIVHDVGVNRAVGTITRGTTNPNRLRRCDRWLVATQRPRLTDRGSTVVDLGFGASPVTTLELAQRLREAGLRCHVVGLEIDPERVAFAREMLRSAGDLRSGVEFAYGGFEIPRPADARVEVVRAFNVLRQYAEAEVPGAWETMRSRLAPDGVVIDGTCDELGRRMTWVLLDRSGPVSLTVSVALPAIDTPSDVAERLPKALIHRNVEGERVHALLRDWDTTWRNAAPLASFGRRQRFVASVRGLRDLGWPVLGGPARWRLGEMTVAWEAVRPGAPMPAPRSR